MFALDCDIYRGTQACLWSGLLRTFLPRHILWSLTVKRTRGYRVILTLKFFCIISSGRGKINFANHPHADIMFYWVIFTTLCGAIPETFKKKNKNSMNDLMKLSHTGLGTSTCTSDHLSICWRNGVQLYIPLVKKNDVWNVPLLWSKQISPFFNITSKSTPSECLFLDCRN